MEQLNTAANLVRVHRPRLTPEEAERRLANIRRAAAELVLAAERVEMKEA